jgi:predicted O-methyltransferase YrrM
MRSYTIESDESRAFASKTIIEHAGLSKVVTVIKGAFASCDALSQPFHSDTDTSLIIPFHFAGVAADVIPNLKRDFGVAIVDLMFLDHSASSYVSDVQVASAQNLLAIGVD